MKKRPTLLEVTAVNDHVTVSGRAVRLPHGHYTQDEMADLIAGKTAEARGGDRRAATLADGLPGHADRRSGTDRRTKRPEPAAFDGNTERFLASEVKRLRDSLDRLRRQRAKAKTNPR